jgi:hypothetical protein
MKHMLHILPFDATYETRVPDAQPNIAAAGRISML